MKECLKFFFHDNIWLSDSDTNIFSFLLSVKISEELTTPGSKARATPGDILSWGDSRSSWKLFSKFLEIDYKEGPCKNSTFGVAVLRGLCPKSKLDLMYVPRFKWYHAHLRVWWIGSVSSELRFIWVPHPGYWEVKHHSHLNNRSRVPCPGPTHLVNKRRHLLSWSSHILLIWSWHCAQKQNDLVGSPNGNYLVTTWWPLDDHLLTTCWSLGDNLVTTCQIIWPKCVWLFYNAIGAVAHCPYKWGVGSAFHRMKIHIFI